MYVLAQTEPDFKFRIQKIRGVLHDIEPLQNTIERYSKDEGNEKLTISTSWEQKRTYDYLSLA